MLYIRIILTLFYFLLPTYGLSQTVISLGKTLSGAAITNSSSNIFRISPNRDQYSAITEGSAFFTESFVIGRIIMSDGQIFDSITLRLDLLDNSVHFINSEEEEMIVSTGIKTVCMYDSSMQKESRFDYSDFIASSAEKGWYQLLDSGVVRLYKRHRKSLRDKATYNSAIIEQFITTDHSYFIIINSVFAQVKKLKLLPDMLQNKKNELLEYINLNSLTGKTHKDYSLVIAYYNSLMIKK